MCCDGRNGCCRIRREEGGNLRRGKRRHADRRRPRPGTHRRAAGCVGECRYFLGPIPVTTFDSVISVRGDSTTLVALIFMPGRSSIASFICPSTSNLRPGGTSYCRFSPFSSVRMTVFGEACHTVPFSDVIVRSTTGRSVTVTYAVRVVPGLTLLRGITTPSIVAVLPGLSWNRR